MIADLADKVAGIKIGWLQPALNRADRHRRRGVGVDDAVHIGQLFVEHAVLCKACLIDRIKRAIQRLSGGIYLHQIGGANLAKMQAIRIDKKGIILTRHFKRDMIINHFIPAHHSKNTITGCQQFARLALILAHFRLGFDCGRHNSLLIALNCYYIMQIL